VQNDSQPKDADYAREATRLIALQTKSASARLTMARAAVTVGNYTPEGRAVWQQYLDNGAPGA
jgi:hypothetical protein